MPTQEQLAGYDAEEFASNIKSILRAFASPYFNFGIWAPESAKIEELILSHAEEPPTVAAITAICTSPLKYDDWDTLQLQGTIFFRILHELSFEQLQVYRPALAGLVAVDCSSSSDPGVQDFARKASSYVKVAKDLQRYVLQPEAVWLSECVRDEIGFRTLSERVHTAEQMRPYMPQLWETFEDPNTPECYRSSQQLLRFPETAISVAAELVNKMLLDKSLLWPNGVELVAYIFGHIQATIPTGDAWMPLQEPAKNLAQVLRERLKQEPYKDDVACLDYLEGVEYWLDRLQDWEEEESEEEESEEEGEGHEEERCGGKRKPHI